VGYRNEDRVFAVVQLSSFWSGNVTNGKAEIARMLISAVTAGLTALYLGSRFAPNFVQTRPALVVTLAIATAWMVSRLMPGAGDGRNVSARKR
jgi:hypothetical protein